MIRISTYGGTKHDYWCSLKFRNFVYDKSWSTLEHKEDRPSWGYDNHKNFALRGVSIGSYETKT